MGQVNLAVGFGGWVGFPIRFQPPQPSESSAPRVSCPKPFALSGTPRSDKMALAEIIFKSGGRYASANSH
jgi:hypothetical protein